MDGARVRRLEALGMIWDAADAAFQENLAAARTYFAEHQTLAAPRNATALDKPVGQWLSNLRRPGALAEHPERAKALAAIDPDWNPTWPIDWQRTYAAVRECLTAGATLPEILPGVTMHGHDIGKWLERQRQHAVWKTLMPEQRERLQQLGIEPVEAPAPVPGKGPEGASGAFERGVAALRQYKARTGSLTVPRSHVEVLEGSSGDSPGEGSDGAGTGQGTAVRLGVWISNTKSRSAKLTAEQLATLAQLGLHWT